MKKIAIAISTLAIFSSCVFGVGIRVSPGTIVLFDAPVGEVYDFATRRNQSIVIGPVERPTIYELDVEPASVGKSFATGYVDFPNPDWFRIGVDSVFIDEGATSEIPMWLDIPNEDGLYNHHWLLGIPVTPISVGGSGPQIQVGAYLLFRFETESKIGVIPKCAENEMVSVPSVAEVEEYIPGDSVSLVLELFQGGPLAGIYTVKPLDPTSEVAVYTIKNTPGYPRLKNPDWIQYPDTVVIPGRDEEAGAVFPITIKVPRGEQFRRFEEILMFEGKNTRPAFMRILVRVKQG